MIRLAQPVRVNIVIASLLAVGLWFPDQSHDVFVSLAEDLRISWLKLAHLTLGAAVLGLLFWFTSHSLLARLSEPVTDTFFNRRVQQALPLAFAAPPFAIIAGAFITTRMQLWAERMAASVIILRQRMLVAAIVYGILSLVLVVYAWAFATSIREQEPPPSPKTRVGKINRWIAKTWAGAEQFTYVHGIIWSAAVALISIALLTSVFTPHHAPDMGPAAVFFYAAAFWCFLFHPLLLWLGRYRVPLLTILVVLGAVFGLTDCNDNHAVRTSNRPLTRPLPTVSAALDAWLESRKDYEPGKPYPVFLVAAEGGGIRNAYWTASVLAHLAERHPDFREHLFAISGVSGGSVGSVVYAALIRAQEGLGKKPGDLVTRARAVLSEDLLSPVIAKGAIADLAQQFLPAWRVLDRATALEHSLERAWDTHEFDGVFDLGFYGLRPDDRKTDVPYLVLNTTEVETGERVPVCHLIPDSTAGGSMKIFADVIPGEIPLSTAAFLSARFPVVTPAGSVEFDVDGRKYRYVDGGYFENSATATVYDMLRELMEHTGTARPAQSPGRRANAVFHVIRIRYIEATGPDPGHSSHWLGDPLSPIRAMLKTREARAEFSRVQLDRFLVDSALLQRPVYETVLPFDVGDEGAHLPLGWSLSVAARQAMDQQLPDKQGAGGSAMNRSSSDEIGEILGTLMGGK